MRSVHVEQGRADKRQGLLRPLQKESRVGGVADLLKDQEFKATVELTQLDALIQIGKQLKRVADSLEIVAVDIQERVKQA